MKKKFQFVVRMTFLTILFAVMTLVTVPNPTYAASDGWIVTCKFSHALADDPIVLPGQPGAAHLHDFVGARKADAFSTVASLKAGGTSCAMPADTSAYWAPALYKNGVRIPPKNTAFYYRQKGAPPGTTVRPFPEGLKIVIGNMHAKSPAENPYLGTNIYFKCGPGSGTALPAPPTQCSSGVMVASLIFPNCWDGKNLDSADHRSHMAYPARGKCPASHPVVLPRLETFYRYAVGTAPIGTITFSSGPYYTAHQDFFNAWEPNALQTLVTNCLNVQVDCGENPTVSGTRVTIGSQANPSEEASNTLFLPVLSH
jgi:hypothetical protein